MCQLFASPDTLLQHTSPAMLCTRIHTMCSLCAGGRCEYGVVLNCLFYHHASPTWARHSTTQRGPAPACMQATTAQQRTSGAVPAQPGRQASGCCKAYVERVMNVMCCSTGSGKGGEQRMPWRSISVLLLARCSGVVAPQNVFEVAEWLEIALVRPSARISVFPRALFDHSVTAVVVHFTCCCGSLHLLPRLLAVSPVPGCWCTQTHTRARSLPAWECTLPRSLPHS